MIRYGLDQAKLAKFRPFLQPNEKVLWVGAPNPNAIFSKGDIFQIPFSMFFTGFSIFWFASAWTATRDSEDSAGSFFPFFGIPFMIISLYMLIGRFIFKRWLNKRTAYAVTDRNIGVLTRTLFGSRFRTADISGLREVQQDIKGNGRGSLTFGTPQPGYGWFANSGLDFFTTSSGTPIAFYDIPDVRNVYDLIMRQREESNRSR